MVLKFRAFTSNRSSELHDHLQKNGYRLVGRGILFARNYEDGYGRRVKIVDYLAHKPTDIFDEGFSDISYKALGLEPGGGPDFFKEIDTHISSNSEGVGKQIRRCLFLFSGQYNSPEQFREIALEVSDILGTAAHPSSMVKYTLPILKQYGHIKTPQDLPNALRILVQKEREYFNYENDESLFSSRIPNAVKKGAFCDLDELKKLPARALSVI